MSNRKETKDSNESTDIAPPKFREKFIPGRINEGQYMDEDGWIWALDTGDITELEKETEKTKNKSKRDVLHLLLISIALIVLIILFIKYGPVI